MNQHAFKLYITGGSLYSQKAVANLERLCAAILPTQCEVRIIDVLADPEQAEADKILATPTLIRYQPAPIRRIVGDLSDLQAVMRALGLSTATPLQ